MSYVYNNTQYNILSVNAKYCEDRANVLSMSLSFNRNR